MASTKKTAQAASLYEQMETAILDVVASANADTICDLIIPKVERHLYSTFGMIPRMIYIKKDDDEEPKKQVGVFHEKYEDVLKLVNLNIPVYLSGRAGTGKNVICKQVAEALDLEFYFTNAVTQEYKLTGFIDANGKYQETQFYKAFTQGGVFFLDEMDASIPEVLIILNAAIANRYFDFPNGKVEAHPDFRVIAAGNTTGKGANSTYTGRYQLDGASLDRFAEIMIDYDRGIEMSMAKGNKELVDFAHAFRKVAENSGVDCLFTYRTIERIAVLEDVIDDLPDVLEMSLLKGMCKDDISTIRYNIVDEPGMGINKFVEALGEL